MLRQTYYVKGLHCRGCTAMISKKFLTLAGVASVNMSLMSGRTNIVADRPLAVADLTEALSEWKQYSAHPEPLLSTSQYFKKVFTTYRPLIIVVSLILAIVAVRQLLAGHFHLEHAMHDFMGFFFLFFGGLKAISWSKFVLAFPEYDIVAARSRAYAWAYPAIELALAFLFITQQYLVLANAVTVVIMGVGAVGIAHALKKPKSFQCACLGGFFSLPLSEVTLYENLIMAAMAVVMLVRLL